MGGSAIDSQENSSCPWLRSGGLERGWVQLESAPDFEDRSLETSIMKAEKDGGGAASHCCLQFLARSGMAMQGVNARDFKRMPMLLQEVKRCHLFNDDDLETGIEIQEDSIFQSDGVPQRFSYNELSEATEDFGKESILGHGGFGVVYRGELKSGSQVAIKRMNPEATQSQGMKEFKSEVRIISKVRHRNLIELRGYCAEGDRKEYMLVYDLMPNGSLDDALFKGTIPLSWLQKFKILTGIADGLSYLHQGLNQQVIHRDIKCSNILLDKELDVKLGDFGISRMVAHQGRAATTDMAGTMGYMAPEVFSENRFTDKADVYAFGVVILEVVCGRRVLPRPSSHDMNLVQWVRFCREKGILLRTVDKRSRDGDAKEIQRVLKVGLICTQLHPQDRPSMRRVLQMLAGDVVVTSVPTSKPTSGLLSARLKNLFYRKVFPGLASRSRQTLSLESPLESSARDRAANASAQNDTTSAVNTSCIPTENGKSEGRTETEWAEQRWTWSLCHSRNFTRER